MRIKEIEYSELRTLRNYNNIRVAIRAELGEGDDPDKVYDELQEIVRKKLVEAGAEEDWYFRRLLDERKALENRVESLRELKNELVDEILREVRDRLYRSFTQGVDAL